MSVKEARFWMFLKVHFLLPFGRLAPTCLSTSLTPMEEEADGTENNRHPLLPL